MQTETSDAGTLGRIATIARNTFREAIRDRILYNLVAFALLITVAAVILGDLTDGHQARTTVNLGLFAILIFGVFISIFVGVSLVSKEIEKRTLFSIFSKPVSRTEFVIGKYLGLCFTVGVNVLIMGSGVTVALAFVGGLGLLAPAWSAIYLIFLELTIIIAIATLFSTFSSPSLSALLTFLIFIIGHLSSSLRELATGFASGIATIVFETLYFLLPNLGLFTFRTEAANGLMPNSAMLLGGTLYAVVYAIIVLAVAVLIFSRRDFK